MEYSESLEENDSFNVYIHYKQIMHSFQLQKRIGKIKQIQKVGNNYVVKQKDILVTSSMQIKRKQVDCPK